MDYFILENGTRQGPYDLVAMIRKIRNGAVTEDTQIEESEVEGAKPAGEIAKLAEVFHESDATSSPETGTHAPSLQKKLIGGWNFLLNHLTATVYSGIITLLTAGCATLFNSFLPTAVTFILTFIFFLLLLFLFIFFVLRMTRGQSTEPGILVPFFAMRLGQLSIAALVIGLMSSVGMFLVIPGLMILAIYIFTPLLIIDRHYQFWDAMEISRKTIFSKGLDFFGLVFGLIVINFIGAFLFFVPLVITLPITFYALAELYDENF